MKVTITDEEAKFLANIITTTDQIPDIPRELDNSWRIWVTTPIVQHDLTPKEARAILTVVGILADYKVSISSIIKMILKDFVVNYQGSNKKPWGHLMRQNYSCSLCGLKSFITYNSKEDDVFTIVTRIGEDHKKREPACLCPLDDLNIVGIATEE